MFTNLKVGLGFDSHPLVKGRPLVLGGITIPHSKGLDGHSDADVLCHAIGDALLGIAGRGDLGVCFPDTDPSLKGISSLIILERIENILREAKLSIINLDCVVIAQEPRLVPHFEAMKEKIAQSLAITPNSISLKATTTEGLGFTGRAEGIAAMAVCLVTKGEG